MLKCTKCKFITNQFNSKKILNSSTYQQFNKKYNSPQFNHIYALLHECVCVYNYIISRFQQYT